jgi:dTDP-glucose 4,6-dehydratase
LNNLEVTKKFLAEAENLFPLGIKVQINFVKDRPGHDLRYAFNSNKIKSEFGWYPKTIFSNGIKLTFNWYLKNKSYYNSISKKDIVSRFGKL